MRDLDVLARLVVASNRSRFSSNPLDAYEAAWHGIAEHLCTAPTRPTRNELLAAGRDTATHEAHANVRHHGSRRDAEHTGWGHAVYWNTGLVAPGPEDRVVDTLALQQILPALTPRERDALQALATAGTQDGAVPLYGAARGNFTTMLSQARTRFRQLWHEGEQPSMHWGPDRRAGQAPGTLTQGSVMRQLRRRRRRAAARQSAGAPS
jgi:hypothetical protein